MKKIKKIYTVLLAFILILNLNVQGSLNDNSVTIQINNPNMYFNNNIIEIDPGRNTVPIVKNDRTLVPIRAIIETLGGNVSWDGNLNSIKLKYKDKIINLAPDSNKAYLDNNQISLDVAPEIINERTMLPIRFIAESFNFKVLWDNSFKTITISECENTEVNIPDSWKNIKNLKVHFIDVGQGDATFIELPNNTTMLIDGGPSFETVTNYIKNLGFNCINYVVATHPDADHITGLPSVLDNFKVDLFYMPDKTHNTKIFEKMLISLKNNGCKNIYGKANDLIFSNYGLNLKIFAPTKNFDDNNNASIVIKLIYKNNSYLFTGDAGVPSEKEMINHNFNLSSDVLKVGHHGSDTSTSIEFLNKVNPKYAVISAGKNNKYGHPKKSVLQLLYGKNIAVYRTDEAGTIIFESDGFNYKINKKDSRFPIIEIPKPITPPILIESNDTTVYKTKSGTKYHRENCIHLKSSKIPISIENAKKEGLTPCKKCNP